jgi:hypothetical protein
MVYFHDWPDVTIHTNKDLPENLDATKLGRVAYMGAGIAWTLAALPDVEAGRLVTVARAEAEKRLADARRRAELASDPADGSLYTREAATTGVAMLRSVGALWPRTASAALAAEAALTFPTPDRRPSAKAGDLRVPVRDEGVRGPLGVYYYDHLAETLGKAPETKLQSRGNGEVLAYECLNLVDGRRSVSQIRDVLTGRYEPVPLAEIAEYLDLLARARVVSWR